MVKSLIVCDCLGSQTIDTGAFSNLDGVRCSKIHTALCTTQSDAAARAIKAGDAVIGCAQEHDRFADMAADLDRPAPLCVDIRDRAGWSDEGAKAGPKMAALLADALRESAPLKSIDISSEGLCLILGPGPAAHEAARLLAPHLGVTVLVDDTDDGAAPGEGYEIIRGAVKRASGGLGNFTVEIDALSLPEPGGRGGATYGAPRDAARTECDIILDLRGAPALFPAPHKRDGYLRADPGNRGDLTEAILEASHLSGTFEKPLYLSLDPLICAHSRAGLAGCSKCLDICPTSAIVPAGDHVDIDPTICAGCGACAALCPSGAITFDDPTPADLFRRMAALATAYREAGGTTARLLVHDRDYGTGMISLAARFGRGLPAEVIPLELGRVSGFGHAEMLAALACGFSGVDVLMSPRTERDALVREHALALALAGEGAALRLLEPDEPDALTAALYDAPEGQAAAEPILPLGTRRQVTRLAVKALRGPLAAPIALPEAAPYGAIIVDTDACTLCLACASLCPAGALGDNPEMPQLRFQEDACLQCGLCTRVCPENAITLAPRFDTSDAVFAQSVLHEEEPFACIECGKLFGVASTIEKISEKLAGKHSMFGSEDAARVIRMCDDCRVNAQFGAGENPFASKDRPQPRTTDDYLSKRRDH